MCLLIAVVQRVLVGEEAGLGVGQVAVGVADVAPLRRAPRGAVLGCGQNEVDANGAAAKVMNFEGLEKKVRPGTFGMMIVG